MKSKVLLSIIIFSLTINKSFSQEWEWSLKATGDQQMYNALGLSVDTDGNMVLAGYYQENLSIAPFSLYTEDDYYADIYLTRINSEKEVEWLQHIETVASYGRHISIITDDDDNIYLTGKKDGAIFVSKYDAQGNEIWTNDFNGYYGYGKSIAIDQFDNVYISGGNGSSFFIAKLDSLGVTVWTKDLWNNYTNACNITDIAVDRFGNIYFIGVFDIETLTLDNFTLEHNGSWGDDTLWGKMDTDGNFIWVKSSDGRTNSNPQIALTSDNHLFLSGSLYAGITFDGIYIEGICCQNPKPYIAKYDTSGNVIWAMGAYGTYGDKGSPHDIKVDYFGNLYLTGSYFTCYGSFCTENDIYIEKYNSNGIHQWRKEFSMSSSDYTNAIDIDNNGFCYYAGYNRSIDFINEDVFVSKNTVGIAQLNTFSSTYKKTEKPQINRKYLPSENSNEVLLVAEGNDIKWYSDFTTTNQIHQGNNYGFSVAEDTILYVTQTVNNIESWPRQVSIKLSELQSSIDIYPNPTNGIINFEFTNKNIQKITISNMSGRQIVEKTEIQQNERLDLSSFESGVYIVIIQTDKEIFTRKIIKR